MLAVLTMCDFILRTPPPKGYNVRSQTRSTWSTSSASCLHPHYSNVSYTYNKSIHISSYHKINHPSSGTNGVCKRTPFSSSYSGRGVRILKHQKSLRCRFQICASLDVASAVDVINDLGLDTLTFLAVTVLIVPAFKTIKASPILGFFFAGVVLNQFGLIRNITDVKVLSEWGILFLLFEMGLELSLARLKALAKFAFGMGLTQVVLSTLAFTSFELPPNDAVGTKILEFLFHSRPDLVNIRSVDEAVVIGAALSLSSSAFVLQESCRQCPLHTHIALNLELGLTSGLFCWKHDSNIINWIGSTASNSLYPVRIPILNGEGKGVTFVCF